MLDLLRVGSGEGPDLTSISELHARFPDLELLAGGGVRNAADLGALADAGARPAPSIATALHNGAISADELRAPADGASRAALEVLDKGGGDVDAGRPPPRRASRGSR